MKVRNLPQPPEDMLLSSPYESDDWAQVFIQARELSMSFTSDGENVHPAIVFQVDKLSAKVAFPLDDIEGLNSVIERLEYYKTIIEGLEEKAQERAELQSLKTKLYNHETNSNH